MKIKTIVGVGLGVVAGMAIANHLTDGAVMSAVSDVVINVKDKFSNKGVGAIEVATDVIEGVGDTVADAVESL